MSEKKKEKEMLMSAVSRELGLMNADFGEANRIASLYRHNVDKQPGDNPELFGRILQELPEELRGNNCVEQAAYTALTLAAFAGNHDWDAGGVADAISRISHNVNLINRFRFAETARDIDELRYHLRRTLKIIAANGISLNYSVLAAELYWWQLSKKSKAFQIRNWEKQLVK